MNFETHVVAWWTVASLLWGSLLMELPGMKGVLRRGWLTAIPFALVAHAITPLVVIGVPYLAGGLWGSKPEFTAEGIGVGVGEAMSIFNPLFFVLCGVLALALTILKGVVLRKFAAEGPPPSAYVGLALSCFLGTTLFVAGIVTNPTTVIARVQSAAGLGGGDLAGAKVGPAGTLMKSAAPLLKYYQDLGRQQKALGERP